MKNVSEATTLNQQQTIIQSKPYEEVSSGIDYWFRRLSRPTAEQASSVLAIFDLKINFYKFVQKSKRKNSVLHKLCEEERTLCYLLDQRRHPSPTRTWQFHNDHAKCDVRFELLKKKKYKLKKKKNNSKSVQQQQPKGVFDRLRSLDQLRRLWQAAIRQSPNEHSDSLIKIVN